MKVAVQRIRTTWTKRSRGAPAATRRNAVPVAFRLPTVELPVLHEVRATEEDDFEPFDEVRQGVPDRHDLRLDERDETLRVFLNARRGMPTRLRRPPAVRLAAGEWVRWRINYRHVDTRNGEWWYSAETVNVAYGPVTPEVFLDEPIHLVDELGQLR